MKYAYVTSISPGYMFSLNCNFNSNHFYDTNADYIVLYDHHMAKEAEYMERCSKAFPFQVKWVDMNSFTDSYHSSKYAVAQTLQEYDSICLIDSDLFICCNTLEYFEKAAREDVLITAEHLWSCLTKDDMPWDNPKKCNNRNVCHIADFPVFINPKFGNKLLADWEFGTTDGVYGSEWQHPLIAFNRSVVTNINKDQLIVLPGELWVCDNNYWKVNYSVGMDGDAKICLTTSFYNNKTPIHAIHNKWWKDGRANGEYLFWRGKTDDPEISKSLDIGEKNFNNIRDFMVKFNEMTPSTKYDLYLKEKMDWRSYLSSWKEGQK